MRSQFSGKLHTMSIPVTIQQLDDFKKDNRPIQQVFPHLNADQREFLLTGATPEEWDELFGE